MSRSFDIYNVAFKRKISRGELHWFCEQPQRSF